jgi:hypothetical protein
MQEDGMLLTEHLPDSESSGFSLSVSSDPRLNSDTLVVETLPAPKPAQAASLLSNITRGRSPGLVLDGCVATAPLHTSQHAGHLVIAQTYTVTVQKMTAPNTGRYLHQVLWQTLGIFSFDDRTAKRQCLTSMYPTVGLFYVMGRAAEAATPFCSEETETLRHWQQECVQFVDAHTQVHDDVWTAVYKSIFRRLPQGVECYKETTIGITDLQFTDSGLHVLKPDGIFFNRTTCKWTIVDFSRSSGDTLAELSKAEQHKVDTHVRWEQPKFGKSPSASTYHCAIAEDALQACLDRIDINSKAQEESLGFSSMVDIRYGTLNNMHSRTSLRAPQGQRDHNP